MGLEYLLNVISSNIRQLRLKFTLRNKYNNIYKTKLEKIGTEYAGWYIPLDYLNENSICYCAGVGEDISFDLGLMKKCNCKIYAFDPTPRAIKHVEETVTDELPYIFNPIGLWDENRELKFYEPKNKNHVSHSI